MSNFPTKLTLAEPGKAYQSSLFLQQWIEVLVDCPRAQGLYTYQIPPDLVVQPGDLLSVPFGTQSVGGIAIRLLESPPEDLEPHRIKQVEDVITSGFFTREFGQLLNRVSQYYCTTLFNVIRMALPPGLLGGSQRRIRLISQALPKGAESFCGNAARQVLGLLMSSETGNYSFVYLQRQVRGVSKGVRELLKRGWVESYLEPPKRHRPKQLKAVTLVVDVFPPDLTKRQLEVVQVLRNRGGELWLQQLLQICRTSSSVVETLERKGCVVIQYREVLRRLDEPSVTRDQAKQLTQQQTNALAAINGLTGFNQVLLHGVTGSGKTEVYLQAIAPILELKQSALVLVPEIALTPQLTDRFRARFGDKVRVYHSALSAGERYDTWRQMLAGDPQIVIGTRSAIFAPLPQLGLIILDEEHDSSFKQNQPAPTYHSRQVAQWRSELEDCPLILGSATPSLSSWVETRQGDGEMGRSLCALSVREDGEKDLVTNHSIYLSLPERIQSRPLPPVEIVDMRRELKQGNRSIFSRSLQDSLKQMYEQGKQGILFIPRRGHSTFVSCRSCGYVMECPNCDVSLSYHHTHAEATEILRCHYCNHSQLQPRHCPECNSPYFKFFGSGTQRVAQELTKSFPELRFLRFDSDTTRTKGSHRHLLNRFANQEVDLLVGTQMLTKGLDIAQVTVVGVVSADGLLHRSDYRAAERAFQTLTQVAGRAGRGEEPGKVIVQTYSPEHPVIQAVRHHDYQSFVTAELEQRQALDYPPYGKLILLKLSSLDGEEVQNTAELIAQACTQMLPEQNCEILGPAPAMIMRVSRRYRWQILLKFNTQEQHESLNLLTLRDLCTHSVSLTIDVDPLNID